MGWIPDTVIADIVRDIIVFICLVLNMALCVYHISFTCTVNTNIRFQYLTILSFIALVFATIYALNLVFYVLYLFQEFTSCKWQLILILWSYTLNKGSLYIFQVERLFYIFTSSAYEFSRIQKNSVRCYLLFTFVLFVILIGFFGDAKYENG